LLHGWINYIFTVNTSLFLRQVTFESERGKGKTGEIGVDNVTLISGLCPEDT